VEVVIIMRSDLVTGVELLLAEGQPLILQVKMVIHGVEVLTMGSDLVTGAKLLLAR
jgi:hypothetical protein